MRDIYKLTKGISMIPIISDVANYLLVPRSYTIYLIFDLAVILDHHYRREPPQKRIQACIMEVVPMPLCFCCCITRNKFFLPTYSKNRFHVHFILGK